MRSLLRCPVSKGNLCDGMKSLDGERHCFFSLALQTDHCRHLISLRMHVYYFASSGPTRSVPRRGRPTPHTGAAGHVHGRQAEGLTWPWTSWGLQGFTIDLSCSVSAYSDKSINCVTRLYRKGKHCIVREHNEVCQRARLSCLCSG